MEDMATVFMAGKKVWHHSLTKFQVCFFLQIRVRFTLFVVYQRQQTTKTEQRAINDVSRLTDR